MKKGILLIALFNFAACQTVTHNIIHKEVSYTDNITLSVSKVVETPDFPEGNATWRSAPRYKFVVLYAAVKNQSEKDQKVDFKNFYMLDEKTNKKYRAEFVFYDFPINFKRVSFTEDLTSNDEIKRKLIFNFPKSASPDTMLVNDKVIKLEREIN